MASKSNSGSSIITALALPALMIGGYAAYTYFKPSEKKQALEQLEEDFQTVTASQVGPQRVAEVAEQLKVAQGKVDAVRAKLSALRSEASVLMRGEVGPMKQLSIGGEIERILSASGLRLVDDHPLLQAPSTRLTTSLKDAEKELGRTLSALASEEVEETPIEMPLDYSGELTPAQWMAEQIRMRVGSFDGPKTQASEMVLVGDYRSMVNGLEAMTDALPGVLVTSVKFEMPAAQDKGPIHLIWNLRLQLRPTPEAVGGDETDAGDVDVAGMPAGMRYTVSKPIASDDADAFESPGAR